ncbi:hypothetical protein BH11MYX1_BH11MYX1_37240 [soil metagenome]
MLAAGDAARVVVTPSIHQMHGLSSLPEPVDADDPSLPGSVAGTTNALQTKSHDALVPYTGQQKVAAEVKLERATMPDPFETARAVWPEISVSRAVFDAALASRVSDEIQLDTLHTSDLYLALACGAGDPGAVAALDRHCGPTIRHATAAAGATPAEQADLAQVVRERLLVSPATGGPAKILSYSGKGALVSWIRVVATREAARMLPIARREPVLDDDDLAYLVAPDDSPELGYLKRLYRAEFKHAFQAAVAALPARDRLVLRQSVLDGLGIDALAKLHNVHRATCARWLEAARAEILAATQKILIEKLELSWNELQSVIRLISSKLDVSLTRVL